MREKQKQTTDTAKSECNGLLAFSVTWEKFPEIISIYAAESRGKAKYMCMRQIRNATWSPRWNEINATRMQSWDNDAIKLGRPGLIDGYNC